MITCQICKHTNPPRAIVCHQCGIHLDQEVLHGESTRIQPKHVPLFHFILTISPTSLHFDADDLQFNLDPEPQIYMGREFAHRFSHAYLDLQPFNGLKYGVSRIHARLQQDPFGQYHVMDLGSTNGTTLNDELLTPFLQYPVPQESFIRLSKLPILIRFSQ